MATTMMLSELRTAAQQRSDMVGSTFVSSAEWTSYINQSCFELYDLLIQKYGDNWYSATPDTSIVTDGTSEQFTLPSTMYHLYGVDLQINGTAGAANGIYVTLKPFNVAERNWYSAPNVVGWNGRTNLRYRLNGSKLWIKPLPASGQTIRLWFAPRFIPLSAESDTFDGISGWTEYVIVDSAIKALVKEESDVSVLMAQKQALIARIEAAAANRDAGMPATVADAQSEWLNPYGGGSW